MKPQSAFHGLLLLVVLAFVGLLMMYVPSYLVDNYDKVAGLGTVWVYVYFSVVGVGGTLMLVSTGWIFWQLWSRSRRKADRRQRSAKSPSELPRDLQQRGGLRREDDRRRPPHPLGAERGDLRRRRLALGHRARRP